MIRGRKRSSLLDPDLLGALLKSVDIENLISLKDHPALSFINEGGRRMLINFDISRPNVCKVEADVMGLGTQATGLLSEIKTVYKQLLKINSLFGELLDYKIFTSCIGTTAKFEDLLSVKFDLMQHCLNSVFFDERKRRSSWIGWVLGDGQQLDQVSSSLKETMSAYNKNFNQLEKLNNTIVVRYNEITTKMNTYYEIY